MELFTNPYLVQRKAYQWKLETPVALVPTMGCLHEGHLSLIRHAQTLSRRVIVSIFVNPLQFGPHEDFNKYPRPFEDDRRKLEDAGVDLLFSPDTSDLYPKGFRTQVGVRELGEHLCGKSRPGHFDGVATVCLKLFQISMADIAVFGEKDFQQLTIIQRMVADMNLPTVIVSHPTVREADGLAMSSRNRYLTPEERGQAGRLPKGLKKAQDRAISSPKSTVAELRAIVTSELNDAGLDTEYVEIASPLDLIPRPDGESLAQIQWPRLFVAARVGKTRLIDNVPLHQEENR